MARMTARIPFEFVLDELAPLAPRVRPMFGAHAIYAGDKMVLVVREKGQDRDDGVWIATQREHHDSLRRELPSIRSIEIFGSAVSSWQIIPSSAPSFEREVAHACALVLRRDARIGTQPKQKKAAKPASPQKPAKAITRKAKSKAPVAAKKKSAAAQSKKNARRNG